MNRTPGIRELLVTAWTVLALSGCENIQVFSQASEPVDGQIKGVPFYSKSPASLQETKLVARELDFSVDMTVGTGKTAVSYHSPPSGAVRLADSRENHILIDGTTETILNSVKGEQKADAIRQTIDAEVANLRRAEGDKAKKELLSNTWSVTMVVNPTRYYITNKQPLFGSATSDFTVGPDGTLSHASSTVQNDTASTILSLFPITAAIAQHWNINPAYLPAAAAAASPAQTGEVEHVIKPPVKKTPAAIPVPVSLTITVNPIHTIYILHKMSGPAPGASTPPYLNQSAMEVPLALGDDGLPSPGVQLVSIEVQTGADSDKSKGDDKGWKFQGQLVPPKPAPEDANMAKQSK